MTTATARRRANRWMTACVAIAIPAAALDIVGIDLMTMPLFVAAAWCALNSQYWLGRAHGHAPEEQP